MSTTGRIGEFRRRRRSIGTYGLEKPKRMKYRFTGN
jgi:hypothetical protein